VSALERLLALAGGGESDSVPSAMAGHRECLAEGRPVCASNAVADVTAAGRPQECPLRYPQHYRRTREQVERIAEQVPPRRGDGR
jgi:hypothetical protein